MELRTINTFLHIAELHSFSRAARELGYSQSAVSSQIAQLEAELGTLAGIEAEVNVSAEDSSYTHPEEVEEFVSKTGCDSLAIAIGTSHGAYKFTAEQLSLIHI